MITHRIAIAGTAVLLALAGLGAPGRSHATGGGDAREIARLVERLSANYRDAIGVSMAHIIERGQAVTLGESCGHRRRRWTRRAMSRFPASG